MWNQSITCSLDVLGPMDWHEPMPAWIGHLDRAKHGLHLDAALSFARVQLAAIRTGTSSLEIIGDLLCDHELLHSL
jgi:hypothetical protein